MKVGKGFKQTMKLFSLVRTKKWLMLTRQLLLISQHFFQEQAKPPLTEKELGVRVCSGDLWHITSSGNRKPKCSKTSSLQTQNWKWWSKSGAWWIEERQEKWWRRCFQALLTITASKCQDHKKSLLFPILKTFLFLRTGKICKKTTLFSRWKMSFCFLTSRQKFKFAFFQNKNCLFHQSKHWFQK